MNKKILDSSAKPVGYSHQIGSFNNNMRKDSIVIGLKGTATLEMTPEGLYFNDELIKDNGEIYEAALAAFKCLAVSSNLLAAQFESSEKLFREVTK